MGKIDDMLSLKNENEKLKRRCVMMEQILDHLHEAVLVTDDKHQIVYFNRTEAKYEHFKDEYVGLKMADIYADTDLSFVFPDPVEESVLKTGNSVVDQQNAYYALSGEQIHSLTSSYPFIYNGKTEGVYTISRLMFSDNVFVNAVLAYEKQLKQKNNHTNRDTSYFLEDIIGNSKAISGVIEQAKTVARYDMPVMIVGETGTGKEMVAQGIHNEGKTNRGDFIAVNCAAVPETLLESILFGVTKGAYTGAVATQGLFEQAENGSIFLDEINSMPITLQMKLLRILQEKRVRPLGGKNEIPINCRIISSTSIDPFDMSDPNSRQIRADLLFRLAGTTIFVPPLRDRKKDIPDLCRHFIHEFARGTSLHVKEISPAVEEKFNQYDWPGNVRELHGIISSSLLNIGTSERYLKAKHLPAYFQGRIDEKQRTASFPLSPICLKDALADYERKIIIETILKYDGNITKSAKELKITRRNLYYKIEKLEIGELLPRPLKLMKKD